MNEKEKIIEEMASDMNYGCVKHDLWPSDAKEIAKALYILGYRKITEPIKLTTIGYGKENGCYYADIIATGQELAQRIYFQASYFEREEIRKETAKEIFETLYEKFGLEEIGKNSRINVTKMQFLRIFREILRGKVEE